MANQQKEFTHYEIIEWLKKDLPEDKTHINYISFKDIIEEQAVEDKSIKSKIEKGKLDIDLNYAVDFIRVEKRKEKSDEDSRLIYVYYYNLFLIACSRNYSSKDIHSLLKNRLVFYQFYFSAIAKIRAIEITLVIPDYIKISDVVKKDFLKNGFGLWILNSGLKKEIVSPSKSLRKRINDEFVLSLDNPDLLLPTIKKICKENKIDFNKFKKSLSNKANDITVFFDQYIQESVDAISNIEPQNIGKRYIDRKLIDLVTRNVSNDALSGLINIHLDKKQDDFSFAKECFESLWQTNFKKDYPKTLLRFDTFLQNYFSNYREHFVHQFQVYLIGEYIINIIPKNTFSCSIDDLKKSWLLSASYHDCAYPLQKYDEYIQEFFNECLSVSIPNMGKLNLQNNYTEDSFSFSLEYILGYLFKHNTKLTTETINAIRKFFYKQITIEKNHGVLGGVGLLKRFDDLQKCEESFKNIILPSAAAIAIHDDDIWQCLSGLNKKSKTEEIKDIVARVYDLKPLSTISLNEDPILFLLILCDNIQDWGRPCVSDELRLKIEAAGVRFKDILIKDGGIIIQLYFNNISDSRCTGYINSKTEVFEKLKELLVSPDIPFRIEYWNNIDKKPTVYNYEII
jgi:hypothetical protein